MSEAVWVLVVVEALLLALSALFSSSETALFSLSVAEVEALAQRSGRGRRLRRLLEDKRSLLVTILLGNLAVNILYFNLGTLLAMQVEGVARALVPVCVLSGILLVGEIVPKILAVPHRRALAMVVVDVFIWLSSALWLPRRVLAAVAAAISRAIVGLRPQEGELTAQELESFVELAYRDGCLEDEEVDWLQALLDLSEVNVKEFMVPRVEIVGCPLDSGRPGVMEVLREHRRNKILVFKRDLDHVLGYIDAKELLSTKDGPLEQLVHDVAHIPESAKASDALELLMGGSDRIAIVVDEFGGTEGLVTREDLVEAVVGDLADEGDLHRAPVELLEEGALDVDARLGLSVLARIFGLRVASAATSVGGLVAAKLGRLPEVGDSVEWEHLRLRVLSLQGRRVHRVRVASLKRRPRRGTTSRAFRMVRRRGKR